MNAERVYRLLLRVYPRAFRSEYSREMTQLFRDEYRIRDVTAVAFWASIMWDAAHSAMSMWVDVWLALGKKYTRTFEVIMKLAGSLAVLFGVFGALNALAEAVAAMRGTLEGALLLAILLGGASAALLITAGAALWRSNLSGRHTATITLVASLVIILIARLTHPWMSGLSQLVGIGLPIALLAVLHWPGRRGPSTSAAA
jgi:hypothetical protein